jgi:hypothetical protein
VLLAWLATPLRADVIDDFIGPKKFVAFGATANTTHTPDGELRCSAPTPWSSAAFWYMNGTYGLPDGQPVEFRLDVVSLSHSGVFAGLGVAFPTPPAAPRGSGRVYALYWPHDRLVLNKGYDTNGYSFLDTPHAVGSGGSPTRGHSADH